MGYYLDESDPDIAVLRRRDGSFVAAFSASGASKVGIIEAAREDYLAGGSFGGSHEGVEEDAAQEEEGVG